MLSVPSVWVIPALDAVALSDVIIAAPPTVTLYAFTLASVTKSSVPPLSATAVPAAPSAAVFPKTKVPAVNVRVPLKVLDPESISAPPVPFTARLTAETAPDIVAIPAVFVKLRFPAVEKPAIEFVTKVPEIVTPPVVLVNAPELAKSQLASVNRLAAIASVPPPLI
jgi:hypothetical protein